MDERLVRQPRADGPNSTPSCEPFFLHLPQMTLSTLSSFLHGSGNCFGARPRRRPQSTLRRRSSAPTEDGIVTASFQFATEQERRGTTRLDSPWRTPPVLNFAGTPIEATMIC